MAGILPHCPLAPLPRGNQRGRACAGISGAFRRLLFSCHVVTRPTLQQRLPRNRRLPNLRTNGCPTACRYRRVRARTPDPNHTTQPSTARHAETWTGALISFTHELLGFHLGISGRPSPRVMECGVEAYSITDEQRRDLCDERCPVGLRYSPCSRAGSARPVRSYILAYALASRWVVHRGHHGSST